MPAVPTADSILKVDALFSFLVPTIIDPKSRSISTFDSLGSSFKSPIDPSLLAKGSWENSVRVRVVEAPMVDTVPLEKSRIT